jgi:squalene-hopene/tetraprenyl-beta-curcumene cyclase
MTDTGAALTSGQLAVVGATAQRASRILLARQDSRGRWTGRSAGDVTLDAEAVLVREFLGVRTPELTSAAAQQIRSMQQPDGSWIGPAEPDGTGDLSASALAYLALRLAGDSPDAYHLAVAAGWIRDAGGTEAVGLIARSWLATFGLTGWADVHVPVPEFVYLPARYAAARGDWAGLSRQVIVSLMISGTLRPVRQLPVDLNELRSSGFACDERRARPRLVLTAAQRVALRTCGQWLIDWQQRAGLPGGRRPYLPCSLVALHALGYPLRHPVLSGGLGWLDSVTARPRPPGRSPAGGRRLLPAERMPPVRDTALAVRALADASVPAEHPALVAAGSWLLAQRIDGPPGPAWSRSGPAAAGWSFGRDGYPVVADTAQVLLALSRINLAGLTGKPAITHAMRWLTGGQGRDGSWGRSAAVTALVVQALATHGAPDAVALRRGVVWLLQAQLPDGSWPGPGGQPELGVTTVVLSALLVAGVLPGKPAVRNAVCWLLSRQNPDAGWSCAATSDQPQRPLASDAPGTAQAVSALVAAGGAETADAVERGAGWLVRAQQADGGWIDVAGSSAGNSGGDVRGSVSRSAAARGGAGSGGNPGERGTAAVTRYSARRRGSLVPGLLLPLGALGQWVAAGGGTGAAGAGAAGAGAAGAWAAGERVIGDWANRDQAIVDRTDLDPANLGRANLGRANPDRANPDRANPDRANLYRANPGRANLGRANLGPANLGQGACEPVTDCRLNRDDVNRHAVNPEGLNRDAVNPGSVNQHEENRHGANRDGMTRDGLNRDPVPAGGD